MTDDRYLPRAPSLRPAPKRKPDRKLDREPHKDLIVHSIVTGRLSGRKPTLPAADLPAPPARVPWEPKED